MKTAVRHNPRLWLNATELVLALPNIRSLAYMAQIPLYNAERVAMSPPTVLQD